MVEPYERRRPEHCYRWKLHRRHRWQKPNLRVVVDLILCVAIYLAVFLGVIWWVG